jgi:hypothetical protein
LGEKYGSYNSLLQARRDPSISGMVLDSAFGSLRQVAKEVALQHVAVPSFILDWALI